MRVIIVGAGMSGLSAARRLAGNGYSVTVFDKGRSPGGRLATRRIAGGRLDHGAQFFTVRGPEFSAQVEQWRAAGLVHVWSNGFEADDGHPRFAGSSGMNALARSMARGLDVRCDHLVFSIRRSPAPHGWAVTVDDGTVVSADALVVTCPLPQAFSLLVESGADFPAELMQTDYDRTLALLTVLDRPSSVPPPGGLTGAQLAGTPFSFIGDNLAKGVSEVPAVTFHADATWSESHWDHDHDTTHQLLVEVAAPWIGPAQVVESQLKRWRFATPRSLWPEPCWISPDTCLVLAGDAFAGPKGTGANLEGAYVSGLAAAEAISRCTPPR